ncbi:hypothetical protein D3C84_1135510 [compost metagenome]
MAKVSRFMTRGIRPGHSIAGIESVDGDFGHFTGEAVGDLDREVAGVIDDIDDEVIGGKAAGVAVADIAEQLRQQA